MSRKEMPVFVDRRAYRRRRMADAARILPIFGAGLICIPLLWTDQAGGAASTGAVMVYLFAVWVLLAILAAVISGYLKPSGQEDDAPKDETE